MSQESLIVKYCKGDSHIVIFDVHNDHQLKTLGVGTQAQFAALDKAVREGKITFEFLLSDAVSGVDDTEIPKSNLELAGGFQVGEKVMCHGAVFTIAYFNLDVDPVTVRIVRGTEEYTPELKYLSPAKFQSKESEEHTGGSSSYYRTRVNNPTTPSNIPYSAECNDIIESLNMTFAEANIFKAVWRTAAARQGKGKKGNNIVYDAEKCMFFSERMLLAANEAEVDE